MPERDLNLLAKRHPHLHLPSYIECGPGWFDLLDTLCARMPAGLRVAQIKEKWGVLCFYEDTLEGLSPELRAEMKGAIGMAESMSRRVCQGCGAPWGSCATWCRWP